MMDDSDFSFAVFDEHCIIDIAKKDKSAGGLNLIEWNK